MRLKRKQGERYMPTGPLVYVVEYDWPLYIWCFSFDLYKPHYAII